MTFCTIQQKLLKKSEAGASPEMATRRRCIFFFFFKPPRGCACARHPGAQAWTKQGPGEQIPVRPTQGPVLPQPPSPGCREEMTTSAKPFLQMSSEDKGVACSCAKDKNTRKRGKVMHACHPSTLGKAEAGESPGVRGQPQLHSTLKIPTLKMGWHLAHCAGKPEPHPITTPQHPPSLQSKDRIPIL